VITVFMVLYGVNFSAYYLIVIRKYKDIFHISEVWVYLCIFIVSGLSIGANIAYLYDNLGIALRHGFFQVASIMSTTGFASADFDTWPQFSRTLLVVLMFIGACSGSTGGGMKVSRIMILFKTMAKEMQTIIHPKSVRAIKMDKKIIPHETLRSVNVYTVWLFVIFAVSCILLSFEGHDLVTNFTAVTATINNIGPGLAKVGATCNFEFFGSFSKAVLIFDMLAGRLELLPMLVLFSPYSWKK
ncbi:MAG: TrkH family potassium uptake protein, partial [Clostridia bacterium]|nr:TrkH family potassium uptake protein [Clostridia bacterium]